MAIVDDVGSFPLPERMSGDEFKRVYRHAREAIYGARQNDSREYGILKDVVLVSFEKKLNTGMDAVSYPQHYPMHAQFMEPIEQYQTEPFLIEKEKALIPEMRILEEEAKNLYEQKGERTLVKMCVTGPIELYLGTEFKSNIYPDIMHNLSRSINYFIKNSLVKNKYVETVEVSIDEPSIGYADLLNVEKDDITGFIEETVKGVNIPVQIHLHSMKSAYLALEAEDISSITGEFAATPENMEFITKKDLDFADKSLRAGVTRTNIDSIIAECLDRGFEPTPADLIDDKKTIQKRIEKLHKRFGDRISSWGPDCGLGSWPTQDAASDLLKRTVEAVRESFK